MLKAEANSLLTTITRIPENVAKVQELAAKCKRFDKEITTSLRDLPEGFGWETVAWVGRPRGSYPEIEAFPGPIHVYRDLWIANLWNVMRCMRLVLAALTIRYLAWRSSPADYRTTREYGITAKMCTTAINDVISSVPFHLGWFSRQNDKHGQFRHSHHRNGENDSEKCLAGYFLLYPLLCLQCQDFLTDAQRVWVKSRLKYIGDRLGVRYANVASQVRNILQSPCVSHILSSCQLTEHL